MSAIGRFQPLIYALGWASSDTVYQFKSEQLYLFQYRVDPQEVGSNLQAVPMLLLQRAQHSSNKFPPVCQTRGLIAINRFPWKSIQEAGKRQYPDFDVCRPIGVVGVL